jgi:hypothetical protein
MEAIAKSAGSTVLQATDYGKSMLGVGLEPKVVELHLLWELKCLPIEGNTVYVVKKRKHNESSSFKGLFSLCG